MTETALVIVNMQSTWTQKTSDYYLWNIDRMIKKTNYLIEYAREMGYKIIFVRHVEEEGEFAATNPHSQLMPELQRQPEDLVITKHKISAYYQTSMDQALQGVENVVVCGVLTNLCVRMFVEESYDRGFRIALIEDLTAAFSDELQEMTLEDLHSTRSGLTIVPLETFVA